MEKEQLEERLKELKKEFEEYNGNIVNLATTYNEKIQKYKDAYNTQITNIYEEAQGRIKKETDKREQTRGAYEEIYYMLYPEQRKTKEQVEQEQVEVKQGVKETEKDDNGQVIEMNSKPIQDTTVTSGYLTTDIDGATSDNTVGELTSTTVTMNSDEPVITNEDIAQLSNNDKVNNQDIPDYLQNEYNKQ